MSTSKRKKDDLWWVSYLFCWEKLRDRGFLSFCCAKYSKNPKGSSWDTRIRLWASWFGFNFGGSCDVFAGKSPLNPDFIFLEYALFLSTLRFIGLGLLNSFFGSQTKVCSHPPLFAGSSLFTPKNQRTPCSHQVSSDIFKLIGRPRLIPWHSNQSNL